MSAITHFIRKGVRQAEIDEYLGGELQRAGYGGVEIAKTPLCERITIHAARPGIVIGRRGKNIRSITDELVNRFGLDNPQIEVKEVNNPELNAKVMAYSLVSAIERGVHRRRAAYSVLRRVLNAGAKGCEIIIAGKLTSKRSRHEAYRMGLVAKSGEISNSYVMRARATAVMKLGTIGVTVSIMRGDVHLPDEIAVQAVQIEDGKIVEDIAEEPTKPTPAKAKKPKPAPTKEKAPAKAAEVAEKKPKAVTKKKTDLDKEVEELSDLIEKTPGEAKPKKAPAKKTTTKKVEKAPAKVEKPKAEPKKTTTKPKATKTEEKKPKAKTTKKTEDTKAKKTVKKEEPKTKKTTKKEDDAKAKKTTKKDSDKKTAKSSTKKDEKETKSKSKKKDDEKKK